MLEYQGLQIVHKRQSQETSACSGSATVRGSRGKAMRLRSVGCNTETSLRVRRSPRPRPCLACMAIEKLCRRSVKSLSVSRRLLSSPQLHMTQNGRGGLIAETRSAKVRLRQNPWWIQVAGHLHSQKLERHAQYNHQQAHRSPWEGSWACVCQARLLASRQRLLSARFGGLCFRVRNKNWVLHGKS